MHWKTFQIEHTVEAMTNTLHSESVSAVLQRLLTEEQQLDPAAFAAAGGFPFDVDAAQRAELFKNVYMSVSETGGRLLYLLARAVRARAVVEYGTSFGISTIYLAGAVRDNGGGTVIGTELQRDKAAAAQRNFVDAGVADLIDLRVGDARETLTDISGPVDLVLLDGWPELALPVLRMLEPRLRPGALILVDDINLDFGHDVHRELLRYPAESDDYLAITLPIGDGIAACVRLG